MGYLCIKQLSLGGTTFHQGDAIPDGVVLADRAGKLKKNGYIAEVSAGTGEFRTGEGVSEGTEVLYTQKEVDAMIADAVAETEKGNEERIAQLQGYVAELQETEPGAYEGTVQLSVKSASDGENEQIMAIPAKPEEIQQVFSVLQMNAEEGAKVIADFTSENVLILLHAADSRKTIKNAAKEQADKLFSTGRVSNESSKGNEAADTNTEGADT